MDKHVNLQSSSTQQSSLPSKPSVPPPDSGADSAVLAVKAAGSSSLFLAAVVLYTFIALLDGIALFNHDVNSPFASVFMILTESTRQSFAFTWKAQIDFTALIIGIAEFVLVLLILSGLWLFFFSSKSRKNSVSTIGLTMIQTVVIIRIIGICIIGLIGIMQLIMDAKKLLIAIGYIPGLSTIHTAGAVIAVILVFALFILLLVYYIKITQTITAVRETAQIKIPYDQISTLIIVINCVSAACSIFSGITTILYGGSPRLFLSELLTAAFFIIISISMLQYRTRIHQLKTASKPIA